ncbi:antibiotic biosynthesis monooxygenase family protein [Cupriavidus sp. CuC1]|uniref:antibiotic biosynthesis monooxygenase family protein n=1 Tax=Cupriavidus sp. CuC1 TaxID=3373131 RepID=UPI0037D8FDAE
MRDEGRDTTAAEYNPEISLWRRVLILEHAEIWIKPGQQADFEAAIIQGLQTVMSRAVGMRGYKLHKCVESPERYVMQISWNTVDDHMVTYRQGPLSPKFRAMVEPFFAQPPVMQHFELLTKDGPDAEDARN